MALDSRYFKTIHSESKDDFEYRIVRPLDNPMILFSKIDGLPLAALHLRCQDNENQNNSKGNRGRALFAKRPYHSEFPCDFQGIINRDGQEFELVISNLNDDGMINFNIMKDNTNVEEVNPGGLNQVNELRAYESYAIKCDQKDNLTLVLNSIKESASDGSKKNITIHEAEKNTKKPVGTYYFLSVVPQLNKPDLIERFKETFWACVDSFILKTKVTHSRSYRRGIVEESFSHSFNESSGIRDQLFSLCSTPSFRSMSEGSRGIKDGSMGTSERYRSIPKSMGFTENKSNIPEEEDDMDMDMDMDSAEEESYITTASLHNKKGKSMSGIAKMNIAKSEKLDEDIIKTSLASTVSGGRKIEVYSAETGVDYNYETASVPCVIGLSISEKLIFSPEPELNNLINLGKELIKEFINKEVQKYIERLTKIYESEECVICFENKETRAIDSVYYQCGHKCCHYDCGSTLKDCPLCRSHITATLKV